MNQQQNNRGRAGQGTHSPSGQRPRPLTPEEQARRRKAAQAKARAAKKENDRREQEKQRLLKARRAEEVQRRRAEEKMRRHDERFELTEEEREIREQMRREEKAFAKRRREKRMRVFFGRLAIFLLMFVVLLGAACGLFYWNLVRYESDARQNFVYQVGEGNRGVSYAYDKMMRGGDLYLNMTPIVELCELATTGDTKELRYISRDGKENVQFIVGSTQVFINGVEERLTSAPVLDDGELYVPYDFFTSYVSGVSALYDSEKQRVTVTKDKDAETGNLLNMAFVIRSVSPMIALDEYNEFGQTSPVEFTADLTLYEDFMNPKERDDYLILVNSAYPLPQSYVPETVEIGDIRRDGRPLQYLDPTAEKAAHAMIMELQSNGYLDVNILLGYRSYGKQRLYFNQTVEEYQKTMSEEQAKIAASAVAQQPGCNPQQAGLSIVMHNLEDTSAAFSKEPAYAWLVENCWKFGYIVRYPADKTAETGMSFQPYFFTYVGRYHAQRIMEAGLSMEEYIAQLEERDYFAMPYSEFRDKLLSEIYM